MINLFKYITESSFSKDNFSHGETYDYITAVLNDIINGKPIAIGKTFAEGFYTPTPEEIKACEKFDPRKSTQEDFNKIFNGKLKWTKIFKSPYSNPNNKGKEFESVFAKKFRDTYQAEIEKCMGVKKGFLDNYTLEMVEKDKRRPIILKNGKLSIYNSEGTAGATLYDGKLENPLNNDTIWLSLKFGKTVCFANPGVAKLFPIVSFNNYKKNGGDYIPGSVGDLNGQFILDTFCIDKNRFADVFVNYVNNNKNAIKDNAVDVTNKINKNDIINFLYDVIGYDYILFHKINGNAHCIDLRQKSDMIKFVGRSIKKATVYYGGKKNGTGKRVDVEVVLNNLIITFNIRSKKSGRAYPTNLLVNYTLL